MIGAAGYVLAQRSYGFRGCDRPQEKMLELMKALHEMCIETDFDKLTQPRIIESAAKSLLHALGREAATIVAAA